MIWPCGQVLPVLPLRPWWTEVGRFRVPLAQCRNLSSAFDHVWSTSQDVHVKEIAENFNDNLAVEWNNKGRKLEQPSQTWKSTLRYSCCYLRVQVPLEQYYSRSRHVTYICPKRFRFFGVLSKNTVHPQASNTIREVLEPLWLWPWEIWELTSDGSWQLASCFRLKAWYPFLSYRTVTLLQFRIAHFDQNMVLASFLLHKLPVTSWQTRLRTNGCSISLHDTSERGCSSNFFRVHHYQAFWLNYVRIISKQKKIFKKKT